MKIAYLSNWKSSSGYGHAARGYLKSLLTTPINVAARHIDVTDETVDDYKRSLETNEHLLKLENNDLRNIDIVIHHTLPHLISPVSTAKNVAMFAWETSDFRDNPLWSYCLNNPRIDAIVTFCKQSSASIMNSGINKPIYVVPHAINNIINNKLNNIFQTTSNCVFLSINEWSKRKNLDGLLRSYFTTFDVDEPVCLILKTFISGRTPQDSLNIINEEIKLIKQSLKLKNTPPIYVITNRLNQIGIDTLHKTANYSINVSYGESFGLSVFESLPFGNPFIVSDSFAYNEYLPKHRNLGWHIPVQDDIVHGVNNGSDTLYTGHEIWQSPNLVLTQTAMRTAFNLWRKRGPDGSKTEYQQMRNGCIKLANKFSYEEIGSQLKKTLENILRV